MEKNLKMVWERIESIKIKHPLTSAGETSTKNVEQPQTLIRMHSKIIDVVAWICIRDRQVLCARTTGKDAFYFPGGKREKGESDWEALRREIQEELNVNLIAETLTEVMVVQEVAHGYTEPTRVTMRCFRADYTGDIMANSEIEAIAWLRYGDLDQCAPATQRVLEYLYQQQWID